MIFGESFENIDGGRYSAAFAVFHRLGQIQFVEENVAELLGRTNIEFASGKLVDIFGLDGDLAFEFG